MARYNEYLLKTYEYAKANKRIYDPISDTYSTGMWCLVYDGNGNPLYFVPIW